MSDNGSNGLFSISEWREGTSLMGRLLDMARPGAIISAPVSAAGKTIITTSEIGVALGFGYGSGEGPVPTDDDLSDGSTLAGGGGGGGGGAAFGRPVAVVIVTEDHVRVEPVMDVTKVSLAFFTALGSMALMLSRMRQESRRS